MAALVAATAMLFVFASAEAAVVATGAVADVDVSQGSIAVYINAAAGSPCASGWYYSYDSDTDQSTVNRMLTIIEAASIAGQSITIYNNTVTCTSGRFGAVNAVTSGGG